MHLGLAVANLALVLSWQNELKRRCTWGIDAAWDLSASGDECDGGTSIVGWSAAASLRVIVTIIFGVGPASGTGSLPVAEVSLT